jgi:hypothetical protein
MNFLTKLQSRKLWVTVGGIITAAVSGQPVLSAILGGVYVVIEGIADAARGKDAAK